MEDHKIGSSLPRVGYEKSVIAKYSVR